MADAPHQGEKEKFIATLASIAQSRSCGICRMQRLGDGHWRWHDFARAELNPIALVQFIDSLPDSEAKTRIRGYVVGCSGLDEEKHREYERQQEATNEA